jgi:S1-C subfamily serine protease
MKRRVWKILALVAGLVMALGVGMVLGGGVVYAVIKLDHRLPIVEAQASDPGHGIVIASVSPGSPAEEAGVVRGDILLEVDGQVLENPGDLLSALTELGAEDQVALTVLHGDDLRTLTATLTERQGRAFLGVTSCGAWTEPGVIHLSEWEPGAAATIVEVVADSPADRAGLEEGDVILSVDGTDLDAETDLADLIASHAPGDTVSLEVTVPGEEPREVTVALGEHPDQVGVAYLGVTYRPVPHLGGLGRVPIPFGEQGPFWIPFEGHEEFEFELPRGLGDAGEDEGVVVLRVTDDSPADDAGLRVGDVITVLDGEPIADARALSSAIAAHEPGDEVVLTVHRPGEEEKREIVVQLGEGTGDDEGKAYLGVGVGSFRIMRTDSEEGQPRRFRFSVPKLDRLIPDLDLDWWPEGHLDEWLERLGEAI